MVRRWWRFSLLAVAAGLLAAAEFSTLREVRVLTVVPAHGRLSGGAHHAYALLVLAAAMPPIGYAALVARVRPAALALTALAAAAAAIVLLRDRPAVDDTGLIGRTYDLAHARAGTGFWLEVAGAGLALGCAVLALAVTRR